MGDLGQRFPMFRDDFLEGMRELTSEADVITPNLTEACLLAGDSYASLYTASSSKEELLDNVGKLAQTLQKQAHRPQTVVITGILWKGKDATTIGNLALADSVPSYVESVYTGTSYSGTGDLFASVLWRLSAPGTFCGGCHEKSSLLSGSCHFPMHRHSRFPEMKEFPLNPIWKCCICSFCLVIHFPILHGVCREITSSGKFVYGICQ